MKKKFTYFTIIAAGLVLASCAGDMIPEYDQSDLNDTPPAVEDEKLPGDDGVVAERLPIEFEISASSLTKAYLDLEDGKSVKWQDGDKVGIFYRYTSAEGDTKIAEAACNVPYEYDAETGKFVAVGTPAYWDEGKGGSNHCVYVYYPYNESSTSYLGIVGNLAVNPTYDATATQNSVASYGCFAGKEEDIDYGKAVSFNALYHQFGLMRLEIHNTTDKDFVIDNVKVTSSSRGLAGAFEFEIVSRNSDQGIWNYVSGGNPTATTVTIDVENGAVAAGEAIDVRFLQRTGSFSGSKFTVVVTTTEGDEYTVTYQGGGTIKGGQRYAKPFNVVSPYKIGDIVVSKGVLFDISGDNLSGKVVYYKNAANSSKAFSSDTELVLDPASSSLEDGQANVEYLKSIDSTLETFPAAKLCDDIGGGWYLPAIGELESLFEAYNGTAVTAATHKSYDSLSGSEKESRVAFNTILTGISGGQKMDLITNSSTGTAFNSSSLSESDGSKAQYLRLTYAEISSTSLTTAPNKSRVRCIKKVTFADLQTTAE